ncbi:MAG: class I SAM-dependent methyltransferase [Saprospiraceae bacterium]
MIIKEFVTQSRIPFYKIVESYIAPNSKVLDIGAGSCSFSEYFKRTDFYQLDNNPRTVEKLKGIYPNYYLSKLPNIPFESNSFDLIHCSHVLEHLEPEDLYQTLIEIDRCLKSNGYLVVSLPLLSDFFYDDLSHVKPYNPAIFIKYLTECNEMNFSRPKISDSYKISKLQYRYKGLKLISGELDLVLNFINNVLYFLRLKKYIKTGYTLILHKLI